MNRLQGINRQFSGSKTLITKEKVEVDGKSYTEVIDYHADREIKINFFNLKGWGYKDSGFEYKSDKKMLYIAGNRYMFGGQALPKFAEYLKGAMGLNVEIEQDQAQEDMEIPPMVLNHAFLEELGNEKFSRRSFMKWERIMHSHGATLQEVVNLRHHTFARVADCVVYPNSQEDCEHLVKVASKHNVVLVPYGGGTNVTMSLKLEDKETRMIVSVDMGRMNRIHWIDKENNMACVGAGFMGQDLEANLKKYGVQTGHEPDSAEFSTLGGWISTRASGMKKNTYGNIEDIVCSFTLVTPTGTYKKSAAWPRISNGPDMDQVILGSEGNFGIITEAILKVSSIPEAKVYESIIFHNFEIGIEFMRAISKTNVWPSSIRLVDNTQFQFGASLKPESNSLWEDFVDAAKKFFVVNVKGFDPNVMVACTMLFEGDQEYVKQSYNRVTSIAKSMGGLLGGAENGKRGYLMTFLIAYIRDTACQFKTMAESFELSCPWSKVSEMCKKVKKRIYDEAAAMGFGADRVWASFRVTQIYETGAAVYVYFSMRYDGMDDSNILALVERYEHVEDCARDEVMLNGGSISHHHGVGKIRKKFMERTVLPTSIRWQQALKNKIDPQNIFAINNTIARSEEEAQRLRQETEKKFGPRTMPSQ